MEKGNKKIIRDEALYLLEDLLDIKEWQKIQDNFSNITEVCLRTLDSQGRLLTLPSKEPRLCSELVKEHRLKDKLCGNCLPTFLGGKGVVDKNLSFICHAGIHNFITPLRLNGDHILGYILLGPVILVAHKPKDYYSQIAAELNIDLEDFWSAILEIKVMSFKGMEALTRLVNDVGEYTIKLAYQKLKVEKEVKMAPDSHKLNKLLNALLDVALQVTQADIGSIMFVDINKDELTIRASRGLPDEISKNTRVRLGEGICGIAAKERRRFLLDDSNTVDNRIRSYLNRPYIASSMVLPIDVEDKVIGVINLGALKTSSVRFNTDNIKLIDKLINLATIALK